MIMGFKIVTCSIQGQGNSFSSPLPVATGQCHHHHHDCLPPGGGGRHKHRLSLAEQKDLPHFPSLLLQAASPFPSCAASPPSRAVTRRISVLGVRIKASPTQQPLTIHAFLPLLSPLLAFSFPFRPLASSLRPVQHACVYVCFSS